MEILRKYGASATILFPLIGAGVQDFESTPVVFATGDTQISKDEGVFANTTNNPAHEGNGIYSLVLTATEMQAARIVITVIDSATKAWEDQAIIIATYGNASAQHAMDFDDSVRGGMTALPNAAADAAGGLPISDAGGLALDTKLANTNEITVARMGALTDWINGGRLDLILDELTTQGDTNETHLTDIKGATFNGTTDSLEAIRNRGDSAWTTATGFSTHTAADVWTVATRDITGGTIDTCTTNTDMRGTDGAYTGTPPTTVQIADAVWDEHQSGHITAGTFGKYLDTEVSGAGSSLTQQQVRDAMKLAPTAGAPAAGSVDEHLDDILTDTADLQANQGNWLTATGFSTHAAADIWSVGTRLLTAGTNIVLAKGVGLTGLNDISVNDVWDEDVDTTHQTAGTAGKKLDDAGAAIDTLNTTVGAAGAGLTDLGGMSTGMKGEVNAEVDNALDTAISGPTTDSINDVLNNLRMSAKTIVTGAAIAGTLSTTEMTTDLTETTNDHYNGRTIIWTSGVLKDQATDITDYVGASKKLTFTAVTEAPSATDTFVIV